VPNNSGQKTTRIAVLGIKGLPSKGGAERVVEAVIKAALRSGCEVTVYGKKSYCEDVSYPGGRFRLVLIKDFGGKYLNPFLFGLSSAIHALIFGRYDVIHLHCADYGFLVPLLRLRFKVIGTSHGAEYNRDKWNREAKLFFKIAEALFVKFTDVCTSVSKTLGEYYSERYGRPVIYIPNGIDFSGDALGNRNQVDNGNEVLTRHKLDKKGYILFASGRIIPSKGCDILLKANRKLNLNIPLIVVGRNDQRDYAGYLEGLVAPNVIFIDFIASKRDLFQLVANCRFFIFPSTYEAMSIMLLEVASLKKGVICSDIPENVEAINTNAVYFRSGDEDDLADKISYAVQNEDKMDELGAKAYEWVRKNRDWNNITEEYIRLFRSV
jgi:glycosyltransferase involved in cell wall biosynthesis